MNKRGELSDKEKAAVTYAYFHRIEDWSVVFDICHTYKTGGHGKQVAVSKWKNHKAVKQYYAEVKAMDEVRVANLLSVELEKAKKEGSSTPVGKVDFTDLAQFISFLNAQANTITDDRDKREYLKMLSDLMRFRESGQKSEDDIHRFYTQIKCGECPLHKEAEARLEQ